jgi:hypothetical protein
MGLSLNLNRLRHALVQCVVRECLVSEAVLVGSRVHAEDKQPSPCMLTRM